MSDFNRRGKLSPWCCWKCFLLVPFQTLVVLTTSGVICPPLLLESSGKRSCLLLFFPGVSLTWHACLHVLGTRSPACDKWPPLQNNRTAPDSLQRTEHFRQGFKKAVMSSVKLYVPSQAWRHTPLVPSLKEAEASRFL